jgi:hypothetical protein
MLRGEMGITKGHGRRGMPQEIAHCGERNSPHNEPGREGMVEVMKVEIGQSCGLAGSIKAMPHIAPPMPGRIVVRSSFLISRGGHRLLVTF